MSKVYKSFLSILLATAIVILASCSVSGQQLNRIQSRCPSPNQLVKSQVSANANGDILYIPCPSMSSIFSGNVDFSGATITGAVTGSGTINFIPRWLTATNNLGDTPISWDGTVYNFNNTALNGEFTMALTPATAGTGLFNVGDFIGGAGATNFFQINNANGNTNLSTTTSVNNLTPLFTINNQALNAEFKLDFTTGAAGLGSVVIGDNTGAGQNFFSITNSTNTAVLNAATVTSNATAITASGAALTVASCVGCANGTYDLANFTNPGSGVASAAVSGNVGTFVFGSAVNGGAGSSSTVFAVETGIGTGVYTTVQTISTGFTLIDNFSFNFFVPTGRRWRHTSVDMTLTLSAIAL